MSEESSTECPPVNVKITQEPTIAESLERAEISKTMAKQLFLEGFRRSVRDPARYGRCFSVLAFLLPHIDFNGTFLDVMELEDMVGDYEGYETHCKEARSEHMKMAQTIGGYRYEDDLYEHKQEIKQLANKLNMHLYKTISENFERLTPLFEEESLEEMIPRPERD